MGENLGGGFGGGGWLCVERGIRCIGGIGSSGVEMTDYGMAICDCLDGCWIRAKSLENLQGDFPTAKAKRAARHDDFGVRLAAEWDWICVQRITKSVEKFCSTKIFDNLEFIGCLLLST
jgi:hypothetical protein